MASYNETLTDILREMCGSHEGMMAFEFEGYATRIKTAYSREVAELKGERNGILEANKSLAADNDRLRLEAEDLRKMLSRRSGHLNAILQKALELGVEVPLELRKVMGDCIEEEDRAMGLGVFAPKEGGAE